MAATLALDAVAAPAADAAREGAELIGTAAPPWQLDDWIGSPALTLAGLRGKVVLVRWFTDTELSALHPDRTGAEPAASRLRRSAGWW